MQISSSRIPSCSHVSVTLIISKFFCWARSASSSVLLKREPALSIAKTNSVVIGLHLVCRAGRYSSFFLSITHRLCLVLKLKPTMKKQTNRKGTLPVLVPYISILSISFVSIHSCMIYFFIQWCACINKTPCIFTSVMTDIPFKVPLRAYTHIRVNLFNQYTQGPEKHVLPPEHTAIDNSSCLYAL